MRDGDPVVRISGCSCVRETAKAMEVLIPDVGNTWIPYSQLSEDSEVKAVGDEGELVISEWLAKEKGLN